MRKRQAGHGGFSPAFFNSNHHHMTTNLNSSNISLDECIRIFLDHIEEDYKELNERLEKLNYKPVETAIKFLNEELARRFQGIHRSGYLVAWEYARTRNMAMINMLPKCKREAAKEIIIEWYNKEYQPLANDLATLKRQFKETSANILEIETKTFTIEIEMRVRQYLLNKRRTRG